MTMKNLAILLALVLTQACNVINADLLAAKDASAGPSDGPGGRKDAAPADAPADMPEPGLILRYPFEDSGTTARDVSGHHKDGTVFAAGTTDTPTAAVWSADGRNGRGIALIGAQYVSLPVGVLEGVDDFTIATWVKVKVTSPWARIYDFGNDGGNNFMYLTISGFKRPPSPTPVPPPDPDPDGLHVSSYGGSVDNENVFATRTEIPTSVWKHVTVTGSGGNRTLYVDGFPAGGSTGGPNVPPREMEPMAPNSWIGKSRFIADAKLNGSLDDFRIYNRVLTPTEVQDLSWPKHDYSYWRFDEATGTSARDSSDNAIAATLTSDVTWTTGRLGGAAKLAGGAGGSSGPHIALTGSPLANCTTELTIAIWVKLQAAGTARIFDFGTGTDRFIYLSASDGTGLHFGMAAPGKTATDVSVGTQPLAPDSAWHHVAVTLDSSMRVTVYVDGMAAKTVTGAAVKPTDLATTTENWIGRSRSVADPFLNGAVDELRVACRAYTAGEITNLSRP